MFAPLRQFPPLHQRNKMSMIASIISLLAGTQDIWAPILTFLFGLILPSPMKRLKKDQEKLVDAERAATEKGTTTGLDELP